MTCALRLSATAIEREFAALGVHRRRIAAARSSMCSRRSQSTLDDARGRWLFDPTHADARSEHAR